MNASSQNALDRIRALYSGPAGSFWQRIERERPTTYLEENVVLGRRREVELLRSWMGDPAGLRILDAGCGRGKLARDLAAAGARVVGADLLFRFAPATLAAARKGELRLAVADFRDLLPARGGPAYDVLILREVLQDYEISEYGKLFEALAHGGAGKLFLTLRQDSLWTPVMRQSWPDGMAETVDMTTLLRRIHLLTPFRLSRKEELRRRNFRSWVVELTCFD